MTTVVRSRRPTWVAPILAAVVAFMLIMAGAFIWFARKPATTQTVGQAPAGATFTASGNVWLQRSDDVLNIDGAKCEGMGAHADVRKGAQVKVTDSSGAQLGAGGLEQGYMVGEGAFRTCVFAFTVAGIPAGRGSYSVAVGTRTPVVHTEDEAHNGADIILN